MTQAGKIFVVAAPSGAGKTSLVNSLVESSEQIDVAVSHTTRPRRRHEIDGVNYHFVSRASFEAMIDENGFVEWAEVFGNFYGTSRDALEKITRSGKHLVLEIDWQGAQQIRRKIEAAVSIFILPPSMQTLQERLTSRAQDDPGTIDKRMQEAINETSHFREFDYLIVNDNFETALADLRSIVAGTGEQLRMESQMTQLQHLLQELLPSSA